MGLVVVAVVVVGLVVVVVGMGLVGLVVVVVEKEVGRHLVGLVGMGLVVVGLGEMVAAGQLVVVEVVGLVAVVEMGTPIRCQQSRTVG